MVRRGEGGGLGKGIPQFFLGQVSEGEFLCVWPGLAIESGRGRKRGKEEGKYIFLTDVYWEVCVWEREKERGR